MKLSKNQKAVMTAAGLRGSIRPMTKDQVDACLRLLANGLMTENDNAPGVYTLTAEGERRIDQELARVA